MERKRNAISFGRINEKNKRKSDAFRIYFENEQKHSFFRYHAGAWRFIEPPAPRLRPFESRKTYTNEKSGLFQPASFGAERGIRSAVSCASLAVPLSRRGGQTQTQLLLLSRPFESRKTKTNKKSGLFQPTSFGAERGIRTLGAISRTQPFQGCTLNHSDISA